MVERDVIIETNKNNSEEDRLVKYNEELSINNNNNDDDGDLQNGPNKNNNSNKRSVSFRRVLVNQKTTKDGDQTGKTTAVITSKPDEVKAKEMVLDALGLKSIDKSYTGTLKAVIKLHKNSVNDKGYRKMEMRPSNSNFSPEEVRNKNELGYRDNPEINAGKNAISSSDDGSHVYYTQLDTSVVSDNRLNESDISTLGENLSKSILQPVKDKNKSGSLIVPERSSSFSIHPDRLCSDICNYCYGKFGSLDTPLHLAQLKNPARQQKILACWYHT